MRSHQRVGNVLSITAMSLFDFYTFSHTSTSTQHSNSHRHQHNATFNWFVCLRNL